MKAALAVLCALLVSGCGSNAVSLAPVPSVTPTPSPIAVASPSLEPSIEPLASLAATVAPPLPLVIVRSSLLGTGSSAALFLEVKNPNTAWGIVRGTFELTVLDKSGSILAVVGNRGLPGAVCCTIYQLPPGGLYAFDLTYELSNVAAARSFEIRVTGGWVEWAPIAGDVPVATVSNAKFSSSSFIGSERSLSVTGRVSVGTGGPYNVWVFALIQGSNGFLYLSGDVACLSAGSKAAFEAKTLAVPPKGATLKRVSAFTTTVPGVGNDQPPGC
jgi:hypothetical protein